MSVRIKTVLEGVLVSLLLALSGVFAGPLAAGESPAAGNDEVRLFVTRWLELSGQNGKFDEVMALYADEVDFYKTGKVKKSEVAADKRNYFGRWPQREHRLVSLAARPGAADNEKEVTLLFHYKIRNAKGVVKEGDANAVLLLRKAKDKFVIISEKEAQAFAVPRDSAATAEIGRGAWTRFGKLIVTKDAESLDVLRLNGKKIYEGPSLEIIKVLSGKNADFVVAASYSGGIACPAMAVVIEVRDPSNYLISGEFGSCSDIMEARLEGDSVIVEMPAYTGHPEFLDEEGRKSLETLKETFVWKNGKLAKRTSGGLVFNRCFPQRGAGADRVLRELQAETGKRAGKDAQNVKSEQIDINNDKHPDWFVAAGVCSAAVGCFGDVYLYYEKSATCPGSGYCYAGSNYNALLAAPDMQLKCETGYRDLAQ